MYKTFTIINSFYSRTTYYLDSSCLLIMPTITVLIGNKMVPQSLLKNRLFYCILSTYGQKQPTQHEITYTLWLNIIARTIIFLPYLILNTYNSKVKLNNGFQNLCLVNLYNLFPKGVIFYSTILHEPMQLHVIEHTTSKS